MRILVSIAALSILCLAATPGAATPRTPRGKWVINFAADQCLATRDYGTSGEPLFLAFKPSPTGELMQLTLVIKDNVSIDATEGPVTIRIDRLPPIGTRFLSFKGVAKGTRQIDINLSMASFAPMSRATSLSILSKGDVNESFALKSMPTLMAQMDRCLVDLQNVWNISAPAQARLKSRASTQIASYFSSDDYPDLAMIKNKGGTVAFVMLVNESGRVADCMVTQTSGVPVLDAQACALVRKRARFTPATGADGKPAKDSDTARIRWVMASESGGTRID